MRRYLLCSLIVCIGNNLSAQDSEYTLFKTVFNEIYTESQTEKQAKIKAYEKSSQEVEPYKNRKPQVAVFGAGKEEQDALTKVVEEAIEEVFNPESKKDKKKDKKPKKKDTKIKFKQVHMKEGQGTALEPAYSKKPEKIKWVSSETVTFEYEEIIDETNLSDEKKKEYKIIGTHNGNTIALNKIGLIEAMQKESQTPEGFKKLKKEFKNAGFDISPILQRSSLLQGTEQKEYLKSQLLQIIDTIVNR